MPKEVEVKDVMTAFEEFKKPTTQRLKEIEKRGAADPVLEAKLAKIEADLARGEDANQKITRAGGSQEGGRRSPSFASPLSASKPRLVAPALAAIQKDSPRQPRLPNTSARSIRSFGRMTPT
jgi:hypothetical protein